MILKTCPHCQSVNLVDENCDYFYCSKCGRKIRLSQDERYSSNWNSIQNSRNSQNIPDAIKEGFDCISQGKYFTAHDIFKSELKKDEDNIYALVGEMICAPHSRNICYSKLKSISDDISREEEQLINKENSKIFSKVYCEFDDSKRIRYMTGTFPSSITIELLTKSCYQNKNIDITSVLISGCVPTIDIFNKFMEFAYSSNDLYSTFDSRFFRPNDLAQLISAGLSTTDKIIDLKRYNVSDKYSNLVEDKVSIRDFFGKYFKGNSSSADITDISDYYRFYAHSYYDNSVMRNNISITPESYLNVIQNYKIKSRYQNVAEYNCFMATTVFGTYDCPELWVLRRFRDKKLYTERSLLPYIDLYYKISPPIIKLFKKSDTFQSFIKSFLFRLVQFLKSKNYEDTPYSDFI